jgi:hypothetical protein
MKNKLIVFLVFALFATGAVSQRIPSWMVELPTVLCLENRIYVVWHKSELYLKVNDIFCSNNEDLV